MLKLIDMPTCAGVKQQLWGLRMRIGATCAPQDVVKSSRDADSARIGTITSVMQQDGDAFALAYLKCKQGGQKVELQGTQVYINGEPAKVRPCHSFGNGREFVDGACHES